ncbi:MAG: hypothetical protein AAGN35_01405 [Bacteroidota bacterium]
MMAIAGMPATTTVAAPICTTTQSIDDSVLDAVFTQAAPDLGMDKSQLWLEYDAGVATVTFLGSDTYRVGASGGLAVVVLDELNS